MGFDTNYTLIEGITQFVIIVSDNLALSVYETIDGLCIGLSQTSLRKVCQIAAFTSFKYNYILLSEVSR